MQRNASLLEECQDTIGFHYATEQACARSVAFEFVIEVPARNSFIEGPRHPIDMTQLGSPDLKRAGRRWASDIGHESYVTEKGQPLTLGERDLEIRPCTKPLRA